MTNKQKVEDELLPQEWEDRKEYLTRLLLTLQFGETDSPSHLEAMSQLETIIQSQQDALLVELLEELPSKNDMDTKYEDITTEGGLNIVVDENNEVVTGNNIAHLAQFADDKGFNEAIDQVTAIINKKLKEVSGE